MSEETVSYLSCNCCGHVVRNVSWDHHPSIRTVTHDNESLPICPECGAYAEFSEAESEADIPSQIDEHARLVEAKAALSLALLGLIRQLPRGHPERLKASKVLAKYTTPWRL
jgi:hypothetical protein